MELKWLWKNSATKRCSDVSSMEMWWWLQMKQLGIVLRVFFFKCLYCLPNGKAHACLTIPLYFPAKRVTYVLLHLACFCLLIWTSLHFSMFSCLSLLRELPMTLWHGFTIIFTNNLAWHLHWLYSFAVQSNAAVYLCSLVWPRRALSGIVLLRRMCTFTMLELWHSFMLGGIEEKVFRVHNRDWSLWVPEGLRTLPVSAGCTRSVSHVERHWKPAQCVRGVFTTLKVRAHNGGKLLFF